MASADFLTIGGGKLYIQRYVNNAVEADMRYFGLTDKLTMTSSADFVEHENTEESIKRIDKKLPTKQTVGLSFATSEISPEMLAMAFLGSSATTSITGATVTAQSVTVKVGAFYPLGHSKVSSVLVQDSTNATTYVAGNDYNVDLDTGIIEILVGSAISDDDVIHVGFTYATMKEDVIEAFIHNTLEAKLTFISNPQSGKRYKYEFYKTNITQTGDYALKSDDWASLSFEAEVLQDDAQTSGSKFVKITTI